MSTKSLTVPEKLLIAALSVRERTATFTAEDLVVEAWKLFPDTFGLSGYADKYPDSNRVLTKIMGTAGMRGKGWLRKVGEKQYRLTSAALNDGSTLIDRPGNAQHAETLRAELDRQSSAALARIAATPAARKAFAGQIELITFNDACGFWDITVRSNANTLQARLAETSAVLDRALAAADSTDQSEALKVVGLVLSRYQLNTLRDLHIQMQDRFNTELDFIRKRTDERLEKRSRLT